MWYTRRMDGPMVHQIVLQIGSRAQLSPSRRHVSICSIVVLNKKEREHSRATITHYCVGLEYLKRRSGIAREGPHQEPIFIGQAEEPLPTRAEINHLWKITR